MKHLSGEYKVDQYIFTEYTFIYRRLLQTGEIQTIKSEYC